MEIKKNDKFTVTIEDMGEDGAGIGRVDGYILNGLLFQQKTLALIEAAGVHIVRTCHLFFVISQI